VRRVFWEGPTFFFYVSLLFVSRSFLRSSHFFGHEITLNSLFCFVFLLYLINYFLYFVHFYTLLKHLWPHQISSIKFDPLLCVHRHAHYICKFTSSCHRVLCLFVCFSNYTYLISNCCFSTLFQKVINRVGWLDDRHRHWSLTNPMWHSDTLCLNWSVIFHCVFIYSNVH